MLLASHQLRVGKHVGGGQIPVIALVGSVDAEIGSGSTCCRIFLVEQLDQLTENTDTRGTTQHGYIHVHRGSSGNHILFQ